VFAVLPSLDYPLGSISSFITVLFIFIKKNEKGGILLTMSDLLKKVKVQNNDGSYSNPIMVSTDGDYIFCYNGKTLNETLRDISSSLLNTIDGSLTFYYLATYLERGVTINTPGWTTTMQQMTN